MIRSVIIDGNHTVHRAWHTPGGATLRTRGGRHSGVVHGVLGSVVHLMSTFNPTHTFVTWDRRSSHHNRLLKEYRARLTRAGKTELLDSTPQIYKESRYQNRTNADHTEFQEIRLPQMQDLQYIMPFLGIRSLCVEGVEGDNLVGIATDILAAHGEVILVSNDHDLYQLLGPNVRMYDPIKKKFYTEEDFRKAYGVEPARFPEIMALMGDDGDDIPGIPGIGDKKAAKLIERHGDIVTMLKNCKEAPKKTVDKTIPEYEEQIKLAYDMSFLMTSASELEPEQRAAFEEQWKVPIRVDWQEIHNFCDAYELRTRLAELKKLLITRADEEALAKCDNLDDLFAYWGDCKRCGLCETRVNLVKYSGNQKAKVVLCGEGPGSSENIRGECFIGKAGKYLTEHCLAPNNLSRDDLHIINTVCCRPTDENGDNRPPSKDEIEACSPRLRNQIRIVAPKVVVLIGDKALKSFFPDAGKISQERGADTPREHPDFPGVKFVAVFHPSYLMRLRPTHSDVIKSRTDWKYIKLLAEAA